MQYIRHLDGVVRDHFSKYREVLVLLGARQVGKTTLLKRLFPRAYYLSIDNESTRSNLDRYDISIYRQILPQTVDTIVLDEIHLLKDPGRAVKIIYDQIPRIKLIVTGSSSLQIKHRTSESLAGRKIEYQMFPLTFSEYITQKGIEPELGYRILDRMIDNMYGGDESIHTFDLQGLLDNILLYGQYPAILDHPNDDVYLGNLVDSVVMKDLLELGLIEHRSAALNLLKLLAYQIGSLVNVSELANRLNINIKTVRRYLQIFETSFIMFSVFPYSSSGRDEIGKMPKIYFYDTGLRNAIINNFQPLTGRIDTGALFENFLISELMKINTYGKFGYTLHYWRTKQGSEIDVVLKGQDGRLLGVEIKLGSNRRINRAFSNRYSQAQIRLVSRKNFY